MDKVYIIVEPEDFCTLLRDEPIAVFEDRTAAVLCCDILETEYNSYEEESLRVEEVPLYKDDAVAAAEDIFRRYFA